MSVLTTPRCLGSPGQKGFLEQRWTREFIFKPPDRFEPKAEEGTWVRVRRVEEVKKQKNKINK